MTDSWVKKADMPTPRWGLSTSVVNGKIYVIGGCLRGADVPLAAVEEYTPDGWQPGQSVSPQGKLVTTWGAIKQRM